MRTSFSLLCAIAASLVHVQGVLALPCEAASPLAPQVLEGFAYLARYDTNGLGAQAQRAGAWHTGRTGIRLCREASGNALRDEAGPSIEISAPLALAIARLEQYFTLPRLAADEHARLHAALLSAQGVAAVRRMFELSIAQRIRTSRRDLVAEVHGQATLVHGAIEFHALPNPLLVTLRRLQDLAGDRAGLTRIYEGEAEAMKLLDANGAFRKFLFHTLPAWEAAGHPAPERRRAMLDYHLDTMAEDAATVIARGTLKDNLQLMVDNDWSGHYIGIWHTHPPTILRDAIVGEEEPLRGPSAADIEVALKSGQNLTIAFVEDGFDAWDLSHMTTAADAESPHRLVRYRSESWRMHFLNLRRQLAN